MIRKLKLFIIIILIWTRNPWWSVSSKVAYILVINIILWLASPNTALCYSYDAIIDDIPEWTDPRPENEQYLEPLPPNFSHIERANDGSTFTYYGDYSVQYTKADGTSTTRIFALPANHEPAYESDHESAYGSNQESDHESDNESDNESEKDTDLVPEQPQPVQINFLSSPQDVMADYTNKIFKQNLSDDDKILVGLDYVAKLVPNDIWPTTKQAMLNRSSSFCLYKDNFQLTLFTDKITPEELYRLVHFSSMYSSYAVCKVNGNTDQLSMFIIARGIHERLQKTMTT